MKKLYFLLFALSPLVINAQYASQNVNMVGHWFNPSQPAEPTYGIKYQGVWGWKQQSTGKEYAILGASDGTYFIDVSNPATPVVCDYVPATHGDLIWHEIKSYQNYCYIVSDDAAPNSFIIADMSYLPDSVHIVKNDNVLFERCHTIYVDGDKLYGGAVTGVGSSFLYSMAVYDLSVDPANPTLIRTLNQDYPSINYAHDMFVRNDTIYASCGYQGLHIYKLDSMFHEIGVLTSYPEQGYNHSSFLTSNGNTLIFMDEVPAGKAIKSLDVSNMSNLTINEVFRSNLGNTPHNPYILGNDILVAANYTDGIQIFNMSNPSGIYCSGYFDTDTIVNYPTYPTSMTYHGCWGAYTDLPSGLVLAADMQNGLYVLDITAAMTNTQTVATPAISAVAYPNPFNADFYINLSTTKSQSLTWSVYDITGKVVLSATENVPGGPILLEIPAADLAKGMYNVVIESEELHSSVKLVKE